MSEQIGLGKTNTKFDWLLEFDAVQRWLREIPSETTRYHYIRNLSRFCKYMDKNPDELIEIAWEREKSNDPNERGLTHQKLLEYYEHLKEHGKSLVRGRKPASKSLLLTYSVLRSFYHYNSVALPKFSRRLGVTASSVEHEKGYIPTPEDVNRLINFAKDVRGKAIISTLASSGQRVAVLSALKLKHVKDDLDKSRSIIVKVPNTLKNKRGLNVNKNRTPYFFGISKDASEYISMMIEERERSGEPINDESWLFRSYARMYQLQGNGKQGKTPIRVVKDSRGEPLSPSGIIDVVRQSAVASGLMKPRRIKGEWSKIHPHVFRKYFKREATKDLTDARMLQVVEFFMGHKVSSLQSAYPMVDFNDPEVIREFYKQIEPSLSWIPKAISELERRKQNLLDSAKLIMTPDKLMILENLLAHAETKEDFEIVTEKLKNIMIVGEPIKKEIKTSHLENIKTVGEKVKESEDCQQVINESELEEYLIKGWRFVAGLNGGKVVIEK